MKFVQIRFILSVLFICLALLFSVASIDSKARADSIYGFSLADFDYDVDDQLLLEIAARVGCEKAAELVAFPTFTSTKRRVRSKAHRRPSLSKAIGTIVRSPRPYDSMLDHLLNRPVIESYCTKHPTQKKDLNAGFTGLRKLVAEAGQRLTLVIIGGYGSHLSKGKSLVPSEKMWQALLPDDDFRVLRLNCRNTYSPDQYCSEEVLAQWEEQHGQIDDSWNERYLFWGYSRGGNTALEVLSKSYELRNQTLGVVTAGSPIGGSVGVMMVDSLVQDTATRLVAQNLALEQLVAASGWSTVLNPAFKWLLGDDSTTVGRWVQMFSRDHLQLLQEGSAALLPRTRRHYLETNFKDQNLGRGDKTIPIYHLAAIMDLAKLTPWPQLTVTNQGLNFDTSRPKTDHLGELMFSPMLAFFPLSDCCVALEHAVLPKSVTPTGLSPRLAGLFAFDHTGFRFDDRDQGSSQDERRAMVDSVLSIVRRDLEARQAARLIQTRRTN